MLGGGYGPATSPREETQFRPNFKIDFTFTIFMPDSADGRRTGGRMSENTARDSHYRNLPLSPDLNHLKTEAKTLKSEFNSGDALAHDFISFHLSMQPAELKLAEAQFAIAKSYGFKSWPRLKAYVEAHALNREDRANLLLKLIFESNYALLQELYSQKETLSGVNIFVASSLGDLATLSSILERNPQLATVIGGPRKTQPITYVAHAPFGMWDRTYPERQQEIVKLLLKHGADPNSFVFEQSRGNKGDGRLSALYGCCKRPGNPEVAQILLQAGANPNDGESLYHASELKETRCLQLLFDAGVDKDSQEYCVRRALDDENPKAVQIYLEHGTNPNHLDWALFRERSFEIVQLLIDYGADINRPSPADHWLLVCRIKGLTPIQIAERNGDSRAVAYFLERGAVDNRKPSDLLIGACARGDRERTEMLRKSHPDMAATLSQQDHRYLPAFARSGRLESVQMMLDAGFDIEARTDDLDATALLYASTNGDVPMIDLLLRRGAKLHVTHKYGANPLGTAIYCAAYFPNPKGEYPRAVERLIDAGLPVLERQLEFAVEHELDEIADVLKSHGAVM
jgi:ankyrin repeat protein